MGDFLIGILGIAFSLVLLKYRERTGDMIGQANWMQKVGGVYNVIIIVAIFMFLFSVAKITGTTDIFLSPLKFLIPKGSAPENVGF